MLVVVDDREPPTVPRAIERLISDAMVVVKRLEVGDIRIGGLTIERKTTQDFINSWFTGRLQEQISGLILKAKRPMLLIHSDDDEDRDITPEDMMRVGERVQTINLALPTVWRPSLEDALLWVASRAEYLRRGDWIEYVKRPVRVVGADSDPVVELFAGLPHVGPELAHRLRLAFKTPKKFSIALQNPHWYDGIEGIGSQKAACIAELWVEGAHTHAKPKRMGGKPKKKPIRPATGGRAAPRPSVVPPTARNTSPSGGKIG